MKHKSKCIDFQINEANALVSLSLYVADSISKLEKEYQKNKIDTSRYIDVRKKYIEIISEFKNKIERIGHD